MCDGTERRDICIHIGGRKQLCLSETRERDQRDVPKVTRTQDAEIPTGPSPVCPLRGVQVRPAFSYPSWTVIRLQDSDRGTYKTNEQDATITYAAAYAGVPGPCCCSDLASRGGAPQKAGLNDATKILCSRRFGGQTQGTEPAVVVKMLLPEPLTTGFPAYMEKHIDAPGLSGQIRLELITRGEREHQTSLGGCQQSTRLC